MFTFTFHQEQYHFLYACAERYQFLTSSSESNVYENITNIPSTPLPDSPYKGIDSGPEFQNPIYDEDNTKDDKNDVETSDKKPIDSDTRKGQNPVYEEDNVRNNDEGKMSAENFVYKDDNVKNNDEGEKSEKR